MPTAAQLDSITPDMLRAVGGEKWSTYPGAIGAFVAEMDFGLAEPIQDALSRAVRSGLVGYLPLPLSVEASEAAAAYLALEHGWAIDPEFVRPVADVMECYAHAIELFSAEGSPVILPTPAYPPFRKVAELRGRKVIEVPMARSGDRWVLPTDGIRAALAGQPGLLVLCSPHNPTGAVPTEAELRELSEVVESAGARVFSDEIHAPLVYPGRRHIPYASLSETAAGHTVTAVSASKAWNLAGLKCAHLVLTSTADLDVWRTRAPRAELGTGTLGAVAAAAAYRHGDPWLQDIRGYLDGNRKLVAELAETMLPGAASTVPESTYFAWIDCRALGIDGNPRDFFLEHADVALSDGAAFGAGGEGHVRFNFATPRPIMLRAFQRMGQALALTLHDAPTRARAAGRSL